MMTKPFFSHEEAVTYYRGALRKEKDALDDEIMRRLKRIGELEDLLRHNERQLKTNSEGNP